MDAIRRANLLAIQRWARTSNARFASAIDRLVSEHLNLVREVERLREQLEEREVDVTIDDLVSAARIKLNGHHG